MLDNGVMFVDTPGMRELGMISFDHGLAESFEDIAEIAKGCRFKDCSHTEEKGCAVLQEVKEGRLSANRYQSYVKLRNRGIVAMTSYVILGLRNLRAPHSARSGSVSNRLGRGAG